MNVSVRNPFEPDLTYEQTIGYQDLVNGAIFEAFRKSVEMTLRKGLAGEGELMRTKLYELLSQLYQPNDFAEMLTKFQLFEKYLRGIEEFKTVLFFLKKHLEE